MTSYAEGTTPFSKGANVFIVLNDIENKASRVFNLFSKNYLKANPDKSNLSFTSKEETSIKIEACIIKCNTSKKLLGIIIDNKFNFTEHVSKLYKSANQKLHALAVFSSYISTNNLILIMNAFSSLQFENLLLTWMFHILSLKNRIDKLQERSLRLVYKVATSSFDEFLKKENPSTVYQRNI